MGHIHAYKFNPLGVWCVEESQRLNGSSLKLLHTFSPQSSDDRLVFLGSRWSYCWTVILGAVVLKHLAVFDVFSKVDPSSSDSSKCGRRFVFPTGFGITISLNKL